jgi:hypothetical protein
LPFPFEAVVKSHNQVSVFSRWIRWKDAKHPTLGTYVAGVEIASAKMKIEAVNDVEYVAFEGVPHCKSQLAIDRDLASILASGGFGDDDKMLVAIGTINGLPECSARTRDIVAFLLRERPGLFEASNKEAPSFA